MQAELPDDLAEGENFDDADATVEGDDFERALSLF
jgi:hypothetical protein